MINNQPVLTIHADGKGKWPPGFGSAFGWIDLNTGKQLVKQIDGLTYHRATYRALRSASRNIPVGSVIRIYCSSRVVVNQIRGWWQANDDTLAGLLYDVQAAIQERDLDVTVSRVSRKENQAGDLL